MHYVCIENGKVIGIQSYEPAVPNTVEVIAITDTEYNQIVGGNFKFNPITRTVVSQDSAVIAARATQQANAEDLEFLRNTDWKVLRHLRQKSLNIPTSLSDADYIALEQQRQAAAARIV